MAMENKNIFPIFLLCCLGSVLFPADAEAQEGVAKPPAKGFVLNKGQVHDAIGAPNEAVQYLCAGPGMNVQVRADGLAYDTYSPSKLDPNAMHFHRLEMHILGIATDATLIGEKAIPENLNYAKSFTTGAEQENVPHFERVRWNSIYPGMDMLMSQDGGSRGNSFKYDLILHPGADLGAIALRFTGFNSASVNDGQLEFSLSGKRLVESIPHSWCLPDGSPVSVHYRVIERSADHLTVGMELADGATIPEGSTLVIDPDPEIQWATYYGDTAYDAGNAISVDESGRVYIAGPTRSFDNIATQGVYETEYTAGQDVFIMKMLPLGSRLWTTYYGGEAWDMPVAIAATPDSGFVLVGNTTSAHVIASPGAQQDSLAGDTDAFVVKFNKAGQRSWGTYLGGALKDSAATCVLDGHGGYLIAGTTRNSSFSGDSLTPVHPFAGGADAFVVRLNSSGHRTWSTFFGGPEDELGNALAVDSSGIWLAGATRSTSGIATDSVAQDSIGGMQDAFLAKLDTAGNLQWATYFGGHANDAATGVAVVGPSAFITGETFSDSLIADTTAHQWNYGGGGDAFIVRIDSGGLLKWATYLGDSAEDRPSRIVRDPGGQVRVIGTTASTQHIATEGVHQEELAGATDAFITKFDTTGHRLWGTYFGGPGADVGSDIVLFNINIMFFTGTTASASGIFHIGARDTLRGGPSDAMVARLYQESYDPGDSTCIDGDCVGVGCNGGPIGGDTLFDFPPDTVYACFGDTVRITFNPDPFPNDFDPVWYNTWCGDPRYFMHLGDTLAFVPDSTMTVSLRGENVYGATQCRYFVVVVDAYPFAFASASTGNCLGDTLQLHASGGDHYSWTGPNGFASNEQDAWDIPIASGDSIVYHLTSFSEHGCTASDSISVQVLPAPNLGFAITDASCFGALDGAISLTALDSAALGFYWPGTGSTTSFANGLGAGTYAVLTSNAQCSRTDSLVVGQPAHPVDTVLVQASLCARANGTITVVVNNEAPPYAFQWSVPGEAAQLTDLLAGTYQGVITDSLGCSYAVNALVNDLGTVAVQAGPDSTLINEGDSLQLLANVAPLDSGTTFHWSPGEGLDCTDCLQPVAQPDSDAVYLFTAVSSYGCTSVDTVRIYVYHPWPTLFVPTIFSPNNDGLNDELCVMGGHIVELCFTIYDRWNEVVFQTTDPAQCWDGTLRGSPLSGGPFRYVLHALRTNGSIVDQAGEITIQR